MSRKGPIGVYKKSKKAIKAERFVDKHILEHGFPPSYAQVGRYMRFKSACQSISICNKFRHKMKPKKIKNKTLDIEPIYKKEVEKMIYDLFRVCDRTVWLDDWSRFEKEFGEVTEKFGFDLYKIFYGKTTAEMKVVNEKKNTPKGINKKKGKLRTLKIKVVSSKS